jgi:hypothetical protein
MAPRDLRRLAILVLLVDGLLFAACAHRWVTLERAWQVWDMRVAARAAIDASLAESARKGELE